MGSGFGLIGWGSIFVWLIILSIVIARMLSHYNRLTRGVTSTGLRDVLESLMKSQQAAQSRFRSIDEAVKLLNQDGALHIQRIGIVRFNPFSDTGGAQSFSLAIVDSKDNGIVMTSLYARNGNRWYVKEIVSGKGNGVELSHEEESAIKHARIKQ
ncbi:hypothetical protein A2875_02695 [Candidatus Gottesmanbacteria bacterium RIFCSPHIGHO2_01_FULL_46_14]|uniref:DUF4446 domain-containing protein n=3 Tax=Microgenomates group TaxID=1794810 RepID=A0A1F5ZQ11_9BACT|nr:MAG: hypothetical protein UU34_C0005G0045 [Candidatus Curtissbacteria bacterium GW2011_GWA1_41_11]OGG14414.1 MAG: hypothetical protein A2875_02695 [Candidatus Gottesmanbacteria bacterium RIFCSPHIGHO2_01_FULL_46_14]OGG28567.1 MAG: hypothetical protein A2971_03735 [Candidatus Gottesmanbacteria bacterium RIFCSPLOWO2_01_FULL_46_21]